MSGERMSRVLYNVQFYSLFTLSLISITVFFILPLLHSAPYAVIGFLFRNIFFLTVVFTLFAIWLVSVLYVKVRKIPVVKPEISERRKRILRKLRRVNLFVFIALIVFIADVSIIYNISPSVLENARLVHATASTLAVLFLSLLLTESFLRKRIP